MSRNRLGRSDFFVSGIRLGVMTFGVGANKKAAFRFMDKAFDVGIDFFDIAEMYSVSPEPSKVGSPRLCWV